MRAILRVIVARPKIDRPDRAVVARLAAEHGLGDVADTLAALAEPGYRLVPAVREARAGASKVGGAPDLPPGAAWPERDGEPLAFLAQVDLADVPDDGVWPGPRAGLLSCWCAIDPDTLAVEEPGSARVEVVIGDGLRRAQPPAALSPELVLGETAVDVVPELTLPSIGVRPAVALEGLGLQDGARLQAYWDLEAALDELQGFTRRGPHPAPRHRLLGHPHNAQGDVLVTLALLGGRGADPEAAVRRGAWRMLLQLGADDEQPGIALGLPAEDLVAGRLDRVEAARE